MNVYHFDSTGLQSVSESALASLRTENQVIWIDVPAPTDSELDRIQALFNFHPLAMEDARNEHQRPKVEEYSDHVFIISNTVSYRDHSLTFHEIDIFLGRNYLITMHESASPVMDEVRRRMAQKRQFTLISSEYVLYVLLDTIVDAYFPLLDQLDDEIEAISERVFEQADKTIMKRLFELKRMLNEAWYVVGQERDMFSILTRHEKDLMTHHDVLEYYLRDVHDHLIRIENIIGVMRDDLGNIADLYVSSTSNRLNQVVNRLSIITIMIGVLTVISGFYGMNFLTTWPPFSADWGVLFVLGLMGVLSAAALLLFKWMHLY